MHPAIQFYNQHSLRTVKIGYKKALFALPRFVNKRLLSLELNTKKVSVFKLPPKNSLLRGFILSQLPAQVGNSLKVHC